MKFALQSVNLQRRVACTLLNYFPNRAGRSDTVNPFLSAAKNIPCNLFSPRRVTGLCSSSVLQRHLCTPGSLIHAAVSLADGEVGECYAFE